MMAVLVGCGGFLNLWAELPTPDLTFAFEDSSQATEGGWNWQWNNDSCTYVDSLRTKEDGTAYRSATIADSFHPGSSTTYGTSYSAAVYADVSAAPNNGVVVSFANNIWLRKVDATTMSFGNADASTMVTASLSTLNAGYHLFIIRKTATTLSIQIDDQEPVVKEAELTTTNPALQVGVDWTGVLAGAEQANGLLIDELLVYKNKELTADECASLVEAYPAIDVRTTEYDLTAADAARKLSEIADLVTGESAVATIKLPAGATFEIDGSMTLSEIRFVTETGDATVSATDASLANIGSVSGSQIAGEATFLYVHAEASSAFPTVVGFSTYAKGGTGTFTLASNNALLSSLRKLKVVEGRLESTLSGAQALTHNRSVTVSGESAELLISAGDGTGYSSSGGTLGAENGGTVTFTRRDTLHTPVVLTGGTFALKDAAASDGRALDLFTKAASTVDFTAKAVDGATAENPTVSTIVATDSTGTTPGNRSILFRDGDAIFSVEENARLDVDAAFISVSDAGGTRGNLVKRGAGVMELKGSTASTYGTETKIEEGTLRLSDAATLGNGAGTVTIASGATLEVVGDGVKTIANPLAGEGTISYAGTGTLVVDNAFAGTFAVSSGTLRIPAASEGTMTVPEGATLELVLSNEQRIDGYTATVTNNGTFRFVNAAGEVLASDAENELVFTPSVPTLTLTEPGTVALSAATWLADGESVTLTDGTPACIVVSGDVTIDVDTNVNLSLLTVKAAEGTTGSLTLTGASKVTVTSSLDVRASLTASSSTLSLPATTIADGCTFTYEMNENGTLPALTGAGTFVKGGTATATFAANTAYEPKMVVTGGVLTFENGSISRLFDITVENGGKLNLGQSHNKLTNANSSITLCGGGTFAFANGNGGGATIAVPVTVDASATDENPAFFDGSYYGNNTAFSGGIVLNGTLKIAPTATSYDNMYNITSAVSGTGKLIVADNPSVTLKAANTVSGGIEVVTSLTIQGATDDTRVIPEGSTVTVDANGTLILNKGTSFATIAGEGKTQVTGAYTFGLGAQNAGSLGAITTPLEIVSGGTFKLRAWRTYALDLPSIVNAGVLKNDGYSGATAATLTIGTDHSYAGAGSNELATTFADGAVLDVTSGVPTFTATAAFEGSLTVRLPAETTFPAKVLSISGLAAKPTSAVVYVGDALAEETYTFTIEEDGLYVAEGGDEQVVVFTSETADVTVSADSEESAVAAAQALAFGEGFEDLKSDYFTYTAKAGESAGSYVVTLALSEAVAPVIGLPGTETEGESLTIADAGDGKSVVVRVANPKKGLYYGYSAGVSLTDLSLDAASFVKCTEDGVLTLGAHTFTGSTGFLKVVALPYAPAAE